MNLLTPAILAQRTLKRVVPVQQSEDNRPTEWIEREFYIPETVDKRFTLAPYQRQTLDYALSRDSMGKFNYSLVLWSDIKKSLKSCLAAAVALWRADTTPYATIYVIANDLKQADSRVAYYIRRAIELNPRLNRLCRIKQHHITFANRSTIESIPIDPTGEAGSNADMLIFSELWGWKHDAAKRMWSEMTLSPTKYGHSQRWCETYAGFVGESPILETLYENIVRNGTRLDSDLEIYEHATSFALWNTRPRLAWQTDEYYKSEAQVLMPNEFERVHRNQWGMSEQSFIDISWWNNCQTDIPALDRREPMVLSIDAGISNDCFALVGVTRKAGVVSVRYVHVWIPPKDGKVDFLDIENEVRNLVSQFNIECVVYDPYQMEYLAARLNESGFVYMRPFSQAGLRLVADKSLYDRIRERRIQHDGNATLKEHIQNANAKLEGDKLRIVKRSESMKIDGCVALSMAAYTIDELEIG